MRPTLPARPIAAPGPARRALENPGISLWTLLTVPFLEFPHYQPYLDMLTFLRETNAVPTCPQGIPTRALPRDCREIAKSPAELLNKLAAGDSNALVIPHGTTWGFYTPPGYTFDKEIPSIAADPKRQPLIEIYSGHGNSEQYQDWRAVNYSAAGKPLCPEPSAGYHPCCWRAGEIIRTRCGDVPAQECERCVAQARANYAAAGIAGRLTVPGAEVEDWQNCGQCTDCFNPAFQYRPGASVQYALARGNFTDPKRPRHLVVGFVAASDNHSARPGTGYKEFARHRMSDAVGPRSEAWRDRILGKPPAPTPESLALNQAAMLKTPVFRVLDFARQASLFYDRRSNGSTQQRT